MCRKQSNESQFFDMHDAPYRNQRSVRFPARCGFNALLESRTRFLSITDTFLFPELVRTGGNRPHERFQCLAQAKNIKSATRKACKVIVIVSS